MSVYFRAPAGSGLPDASETVKGIIRIATSAEATAGTDDLTAITPLKLKSVVDAAVVGGVTYKGTFDAAAPLDLSNAEQGDLYVINGAGTYQGQTWAVGDHLLVNADMGGTVSPSKIDKIDSTDSVTSVAGKTGAVTLVAGDVGGLATVATTGAYSDLSGTPTLATVATTGAYSDLSGTPTLGTAAALDVGTSASNVVQLNGSAQLPAVDGSLLTGITASVAALNDVGDVNAPTPANTNVLKYNSTSGDWESGAVAASEVSGLATVASTGAYSDLSGTPTLGTAAAEDVGTLAGNVVQLDGTAKLPAVDGSQLTNLPPAPVTSVAGKTGVVTLVAGDISGLATVATTGAYSDLSGTPTLGTAAAEDVGTLAGNVVQLDGTAKLPAVDGSQLTNLPSAPVTSVAGKTGAVTLVAGDISGLATVATTGAYSDLTGTPTLGTAAAEDVGTLAGNVVQLDGTAKLPAVDGSQLTNLPVTSVAGKTGAVTLVIDDMTDVDTTTATPSAGDLLEWDGSNWVPVARFEVVATITLSSNLTVPEHEQLVRTSGSGITLTLPNIASNSIAAGVRYQIKVTDANTVTISPNATELLEGLNSSYTTGGAKEALTVLCDGSGWWFV